MQFITLLSIAAGSDERMSISWLTCVTNDKMKEDLRHHSWIEDLTTSQEMIYSLLDWKYQQNTPIENVRLCETQGKGSARLSFCSSYWRTRNLMLNYEHTAWCNMKNLFDNRMNEPTSKRIEVKILFWQPGFITLLFSKTVNLSWLVWNTNSSFNLLEQTSLVHLDTAYPSQFRMKTAQMCHQLEWGQ